jgi:hypothetical protein
MFSYKDSKPLALLMFLILMLLISFQLCRTQSGIYSQKIKMVDHIYSLEIQMDEVENCLKQPNPDLELLQKDLIMNLLGKSFAEIEAVLGEPEKQGYSNLYGPHNYMLFDFETGPIRFCSPDDVENQLAVIIILGAGQEVLGTRVGMTFAEIEDIVGAPAFGPELGMDNLYYMDYYFGETTNQVPEVFISFSANAINSPTHNAFIKWEAFEYDKVETI